MIEKNISDYTKHLTVTIIEKQLGFIKINEIMIFYLIFDIKINQSSFKLSY